MNCESAYFAIAGNGEGGFARNQDGNLMVYIVNQDRAQTIQNQRGEVVGAPVGYSPDWQ
jgi:hypothetical protein